MKNKSYKCQICDVMFAVNISLKGQSALEREKNLTNDQTDWEFVRFFLSHVLKKEHISSSHEESKHL